MRSGAVQPSGRAAFELPNWRVGDRVRLVNRPLPVLQSLHQTCTLACGRTAGWPAAMTAYIGHVGWVSGYDGQTTKVRFYGTPDISSSSPSLPLLRNDGLGKTAAVREWCFHPAALKAVTDFSFEFGDLAVLLSTAHTSSALHLQAKDINRTLVSVVTSNDAIIWRDRRLYTVQGDHGSRGVEADDQTLIPVYTARRVDELTAHGGDDPKIMPPAHRELGFGLAQPEPVHINNFVMAAQKGDNDFAVYFIRIHPSFANELSTDPGELRGLSAVAAAARFGQLGVLATLLVTGQCAAKVDANAKSRSGDNAYHQAVLGDRPRSIATLFEFMKERGEVNAKNVHGLTPLHLAIRDGKLTCLKELLNIPHIDVNAKDLDDSTPAHAAVDKGGSFGLDAIRELAKPSNGIVSFQPELTNKGGFNVLLWATVNNNLPVVRLLLDKAPTLVSSAKSDNCTALHLATFNGNAEICSALLGCDGVSIGAMTIRLQSVMHTLLSPLTVALPEHLADTATASPRLQRLHIAASLIEREPNWAPDASQNTPLHLALKAVARRSARLGEVPPQLVERLTMPPGGVLPVLDWLCVAVGDDWAELGIALWLLAAGADVAALNESGQSPLDMAPTQIPRGLWEAWAALGRKETAPPLPVAEAEPEVSEGRLCSSGRCPDGTKADVDFLPCAHRVFCRLCVTFMSLRSCPTCGVPIKAHRQPGGLVVEQAPAASPIDDIAAATTRLLDDDDKTTCSICFDRKLDMTFQCGHLTCSVCGELCRHCPVCRLPVTNRLKIFSPWSM